MGELRSVIPADILRRYEEDQVHKTETDKTRAIVDDDGKGNNHQSGSITLNKKNEKIETPKKDGFYIIESILKKRGSHYLVKWKDYPKEQSTWEPQSNIPKDIINNFEMITSNPFSDDDTSPAYMEPDFNQQQKIHEKKRTLGFNKSNIHGKRSKYFNGKVKKRIELIPIKQNFRGDDKIIDKNIRSKTNEKKSSLGNRHAQTMPKEVISKTKEVYLVEKLLDKKGSKYLVKWKDYSNDQNTWEPKSNIPNNII